MADSDRRELQNDVGVAIRANNDALQASIWTALPGYIVEFDRVLQTCKVQPTIQAQVLTAAGVTKNVTLPVLVDCPVTFPSGGGFALTFPLKVGDECLVIFASRCIDSWWHSGGIQVQAELRMHDLSDGFVIPGPRSRPNVLPNIAVDQVQLRNFAGTTHVSIFDNGNVDVKSDGNVIVTAPFISMTGNVTIVGNLTVTGIVAAEDFATPILPSYAVHLHEGVRNGPNVSGPPTVGT